MNPRPAAPAVTTVYRRDDHAPTTMFDAPTRALVAQGSGVSPLAPSLPPELEREVFQLARRFALQADLAAALSVLRDGLCRLAGTPDAMTIFYDPAIGSAWAAPSAGAPAMPINDQVLDLVARSACRGERVYLGHALIEPVGPAPARAVLVLRRHPEAPVFDALAVATVAAIAHAISGLVGHFLSAHAARRSEDERDARSPFRHEVLAERRRIGSAPGRLIAAPRRWVRWAYPTLIALVAALIAAAALIQVPTYSTGVAMITVESTHVTSPAPGTVAAVLVAPGAQVAAGAPLVRMHAIEEEAELAAATTDYRNALAVFLSNPGDDAARAGLAMIATRRLRARAAVEARTLRAPHAGTIGDIRVRAGQLLVPGAQVVKILHPGATPSVIALLPGTDRPRFAPGMTVQLELPGYVKQRELATIDSIDTQVIGPEEARRSLGDPIGDALPISGPVVIVRAHLDASTFESNGQVYELHDGMLARAEVRVDQRSLLRTILPGKGD